jgi:hypothetical protein
MPGYVDGSPGIDTPNSPADGAVAAYRHPRYVEAFAEQGKPLHLSGSNGWLLVRRIQDTMHCDAMGSYPLFCCADWSRLKMDLEALRNRLVSVVLVTDPFGSYTMDELAKAFDNVRQFKEHYVVDLTRPLEENVSKSNRATARRALRKLEIRVLLNPVECIDDWTRLFERMVRRQNLSGLRSYSRMSFLKQFQTPGAVMFEVRSEGDVVGLDMIYVDGDHAYGHVCAFSEVGYRLRASYATRWRMLEYLQGRVRYLDFGGSVGTSDAPAGDGLADYKRRWCALRMPVYLCTSVLNPAVYGELSAARGTREKPGYFPAYRVGEYR